MSIFTRSKKKAHKAETTHHHEHSVVADGALDGAIAASEHAELQRKAKDHLWMHFARQSGMEAGNGVPIIVRGEGHHVFDAEGKKYIDGLSGLFVVQVGHGRERLAEAARKQAEELAFFPLWSYAHPPTSWPTTHPVT